MNAWAATRSAFERFCSSNDSSMGVASFSPSRAPSMAATVSLRSLSASTQLLRASVAIFEALSSADSIPAISSFRALICALSLSSSSFALATSSVRVSILAPDALTSSWNCFVVLAHQRLKSVYVTSSLWPSSSAFFFKSLIREMTWAIGWVFATVLAFFTACNALFIFALSIRPIFTASEGDQKEKTTVATVSATESCMVGLQKLAEGRSGQG
mmetsp:Transcript_53177/g.119883  ORF Transcript_53177/g.119883 Transcript_53177/m.119883 type:complete len:214 (-) Transcript_53177:35-676(-)